MKVLNPDEMRRMDEACIRQFGIPAQILMENAASSSFNLIQSRYPEMPVLVICGSGNNGGDGMALARKIHSAGRDVKVLIQGNPEKFSAETSLNYKILKRIGLPVIHNPEQETIRALTESPGLIVDAYLGTGLNRYIDEKGRFLIEAINAGGHAVVSLDIPSGLDGTSGEPRGTAVLADCTICFGALKRGNIMAPGIPYNGDLYHSSISFPGELYENESLRSELNLPLPLKSRDPLGYKNSFGKVLIIGGGAGYLGAPALAAKAAYRSGAGYVTAAIPISRCESFTVQCPEAVMFGLEETSDKTISLKNADSLIALSAKHDAVLLGPGMTNHPETVKLIRKIIPLIGRPLVLDADGLNALAGFPELTGNRKEITVITPHMGEQKRLAADFSGSLSIEEKYAAVCVYKGPRTRICFPGGQEYINLTGTDALGTAGTGDVLAGMIVSMICTAENVRQGVGRAVLIHGLTSERFRGAGDSFTASDIISLLPETLGDFRKNYKQLNDSCYGRIHRIP